MSIGNTKLKETLVEDGTEFQGTMKSACPVMVNGTIDGSIEAPALTISSTGTVQGTVQVQELKSDGSLAGNIDADRVSLSGKVHSDTVIRAKSLEVKLASETGKLEVTFGECNLEVGDEPSANAEDSDQDSEKHNSMPPVHDTVTASDDDDDDSRTNGVSMDRSWSQPPPAN